MSQSGRRSGRLANARKPLGDINSLSSYERRRDGNSLLKSSINATNILLEGSFKKSEHFALCKDISLRRDNTGVNPVVATKVKSSNGSQEKKKVKPRNRLLGLRSKTKLSSYVKDDTKFTDTKPLLSSLPNIVVSCIENAEVADNSDCHEDKYNNTLTLSPSLNECVSPFGKICNMNEEESENDISSTNRAHSFFVFHSLETIYEESGEEEEEPDYCNSININKIINLFEDLKNEKEDMESKWSAFMEQKEVFENKWNNFNFLFRAYERNVTSSKKKSKSSDSAKGKSKVITKLRPSFVNPANICLKLPKASSNSSSSNRYPEKKSNFGNCKTPVSNDKLLKRFRMSTCYTPNSLSTVVDDQAKDIFGS